MEKLKRMAVALLSLFLLVGCEQPKVVDDIRIVQALGYDYYDESHILGTITTPIYAHTGGSGQVQATADTYSVVSHIGRTLNTLLESRSEFPLEIGKLLVILYGKDLAKGGLFPYIDVVNRNPDVGRTISLAVVDGRAETILNHKFTTDQLVSAYLNDLIQHNTKASFPKNNLHEFLYSYFGDGMDPFMPLLKLKQHHVEIEGIALFKGDNYVDYLPFEYAYPFKMMFESFNDGSYEVPINRNHYMSITNISSKVDYKVENASSNRPIIYINVKEKGFLRESSSTMQPKQNIKEIERIMERTLEREGNQILEMLKKLGVDPLRLGDKVRSYDRGWSEEKWRAIYPHVTVKLDVRTTLAQTGIIE